MVNKKNLASVVGFINFIIMKIDVGVAKKEVACCKLLLENTSKYTSM